MGLASISFHGLSRYFSALPLSVDQGPIGSPEDVDYIQGATNHSAGRSRGGRDVAYKLQVLRFEWNVVAWGVVDERLHNFMRETSQLQSPSTVVREAKW
jgi:hypothetical protein